MIYVLLLLILTSCGKVNFELDRFSDFYGTYESPCIATDGPNIKFKANISHSQLVTNLSVYLDAGASTCSDNSRVFVVTDTSKLVFKNEYTDKVNGAHLAYEIDLTVESTFLTVYNNGTTDGVAAANNGAFGADCSLLGVWVEGVPNDVTGIACGDTEGGSNASAGKKEYTFFDLNKSVKPFVLTPGDTDADPNYDGSTKAKRPKELLDILLRKK